MTGFRWRMSPENPQSNLQQLVRRRPLLLMCKRSPQKVSLSPVCSLTVGSEVSWMSRTVLAVSSLQSDNRSRYDSPFCSGGGALMWTDKCLPTILNPIALTCVVFRHCGSPWHFPVDNYSVSKSWVFRWNPDSPSSAITRSKPLCPRVKYLQSTRRSHPPTLHVGLGSHQLMFTCCIN